MGFVVVYGALRSGSTLLRLMINAHPKLSCSGEHDFLFDHIRESYDREALSADRIFRASGVHFPIGKDGRDAAADMIAQLKSDVLILHRNLGQLLDLFPDCRIIHLLRDARDVARSSVGMGWAGNVNHGVTHWLETEQAWERHASLLNPSNVLTLRYEDLITDPIAKLTEVALFCGQPFDGAMLSYPKDSTYAAPNPSLVDQWRHKLSARELGLIEARASDLLCKRGYALSL